MKITGGCHCGEIQYEAELSPEKVGICHCSDCQKLSASAFRTVALVPSDALTFTKGTAKRYQKIADSGNKRDQGFCANCGSGLFSVDPDAPDVYVLRAGTIDQRAELKPQFEIWTSSALPWVPEFDGTAKMPCGPT